MVDLSTSFTLAGITGFVYDDVNDVLYLAAGNSVQRWSGVTQTFDTAITVSANLTDIDISADGSYLLVTDGDILLGGGQERAIVHRVELDGSPSVEELRFAIDYDNLESGTFEIAIADDEALVSTNFAGSGWTPIRSFDDEATNPAFDVVDGLGGTNQSSYLIASEDNRYVLVMESNISSAPISIYVHFPTR